MQEVAEKNVDVAETVVADAEDGNENMLPIALRVRFFERVAGKVEIREYCVVGKGGSLAWKEDQGGKVEAWSVWLSKDITLSPIMIDGKHATAFDLLLADGDLLQWNLAFVGSSLVQSLMAPPTLPY